MSTATATRATKAEASLMENIFILDDQIAASAAARKPLVAKLMARLEVGASVRSDLGTCTKVQGTITDTDYEGMVEARPSWMRKVQKTVLDGVKFALLRKAGEVPAEILEFVTERPGSPYLKITRDNGVEVTKPFGAAKPRV